MPALSTRQAGRQRGFSLVEALVAVVVLSVGLLGTGQLVLASLRESAGALARTQAVLLVGDMIERIRANPDAQGAYDCAAYPDGPSEHGCAPSGVPALECTARELAEDDLARWQSLARQSLPFVPPGKCELNVIYFAANAGAEPSRYRVVVTWQQPGMASAAQLAGDLRLAGRVPT